MPLYSFIGSDISMYAAASSINIHCVDMEVPAITLSEIAELMKDKYAKSEFTSKTMKESSYNGNKCVVNDLEMAVPGQEEMTMSLTQVIFLKSGRATVITYGGLKQCSAAMQPEFDAVLNTIVIK